jgi:hypothetical protein
VESSCERGNESSGSIKCWNTVELLHTTGALLSSAQLHRVSYDLIAPGGFPCLLNS